MMLGRRHAELELLIDRVRSRRGGSLVVRGEPGVGKTTLVDQALGVAPECRVVRVAGVEAERDLGLAAIHRLCEQVFSGLERLPDRQAEALRAAFGLNATGSPDRLLLGLAVRSLLAEAADARPLVCVVDDAQWLDGPSARTLAFVARRLDTLPVGLVFASREPRDELLGLSDVQVERLSPAEARLLIDRLIPGAFDEEVRARIVSETEGNPVAIAELLSGVRPEDFAGGFGPPDAISLPAVLKETFLHRVEQLPNDVRRVLVVAAAEPLGRPGLLWRATEVLGLAPAAIDRAEEEGLLRLGTTVRFSHPAMRSAVYRTAPPAERRQAHRALAEATDPLVDPERRAWHRGEATSDPDEEVAAELERAADPARVRGGLAAAAALLDRAAALTPHPARRSERLLAAGQAKFSVGAIDEALALVARADSRLLDGQQGAQLEHLLAQAAALQSGQREPASHLLSAAKRLEPLDVGLARESHLSAFEAAIRAGHLSNEVGVSQSASAARAALPATQPPQPHDVLLDGLAALFSDGYAVAVPVLKKALNLMEEEGQSRWLSLGAGIAADLWADGTARTLATRQRELALRDGALTALHRSLETLAMLSVHSGDFVAAADLIDQTSVLTTPMVRSAAPCAALMLAAFRGREADASQLVEATIEHAKRHCEGRVIAFAEEMTAVLQNSLGNYREALTAAQAASRHEQLGVSDRALAELVEAAARCGEPQVGEGALERLSERTALSGTDWALGIEARSRALLSEARAADKLYRIAIERLGQCSVSTALARAHLVYGEWLRREGRRAEARQQLRTSLHMFTDMGAQAFSERAERELLATGERLRKRRAETREQLTSQEAQISQLARDGHSNPEIAAKLFISPRTVEYHLTKVFTKLGISSRNQLHRVLAQGDESPLGLELESRLASG
ncbi:MAG: LuxR family transcriptional regulator [Nocardioides sp.]|nr:LuxR family transcriptional regulator [Nocardioides sp.]